MIFTLGIIGSAETISPCDGKGQDGGHNLLKVERQVGPVQKLVVQFS